LSMMVDCEKINAHLNKVAFYYDIAGLAAGIGTGTSTGPIYKGAAGYKNIETKELMTPDAVFHMASVTKLFVGTAIMKLYEQGIIDLDQALIQYMPAFRMADERFHRITLRQLLNHTSGMPDVKDYNWDKPETDDKALARYVESEEVTGARLLWEPGSGQFAYSNMAYEVLGLLLADLSGMPFEEHIDESLLKPLGMNCSTLLTFTRDMRQVCAPHVKSANKEIKVAAVFPYNRAHGPSSTLTSTLEDMAKWGKAHLNKSVLKGKTYDEMWKSYAVVPNNAEHIGLSWFIREQSGYQLLGHEGTDDGFRSSFWICPELDLHITVMANMTGAPVKKINRQLLDILLGVEPKL
jgi:CubicO group peptidase (beta-lactamase class C family)